MTAVKVWWPVPLQMLGESYFRLEHLITDSAVKLDVLLRLYHLLVRSTFLVQNQGEVIAKGLKIKMQLAPF